MMDTCLLQHVDVVYAIPPLLLALLAAAGVGGFFFQDKKSKRDYELGLKQLDFQRDQMKASGNASIRAMDMQRAMAGEDRKAAMDMRRQDREYGRMDKQDDRQMTEQMMQMQLIQAILQGRQEGKPQRTSGEMAVSRLIGAM